MNASEIFQSLPRLGSYLLADENLAMIEFKGGDVLEWLQGQATNDLRGISEGHPISFCLCQATGQMLALCELHILGHRNIVLTDNGAAVLGRAKEMVVMEDVEAIDMHLSLKAPAAIDIAQRLALGIPKRAIDYTDRTLPPELGRAFEEKHISYNKGCYTGQEVLMRIHSRGHTNKTWVGLLMDAPVEVGARVTHDAKEVGVITSALVSPRLGPIAAAMLKNEAAQEGTTVSVGGINGGVKNFPLG